MADALRHLTRLGVYKVAMPVSRKFLEIFYQNKPFLINRVAVFPAAIGSLASEGRRPLVVD